MSLQTSLVSWWKLDETSGTRSDAHGSNDLTDVNTVGSATGKQGNGADFEYSNLERLTISDASQTGLDLSTDFSFACWIKIESTGAGVNHYLMGKWGASSNRSYYFSYRDYDFQVGYFDGTNITRGGTNANVVSDGTWYHLVATMDISAASLTLYINGSEVTTSMDLTGATSINNGAGAFQIGSIDASTVETFDGIIDEVGVWSKILTQDEVTALYNQGDGITYEDTDPADVSTSNLLSKNLVSYWKLDEASGTRADSHGSNDLTDNNTVTSATGKVGDAGQFTAANSEWLEITNVSQTGLESNFSFSVAGWVYLDSLPSTGAYIGWVTKWDNVGTDNDYVFRFAYQNLAGVYKWQARFANNPTFTNNQWNYTMSTATWYHTVMVFNDTANTVELFVNGVSQGTSAVSITPQDGGADFKIGAAENSTSTYWNGRIDETAYYSKALTVEEITQLYNAGSGLAYEATVGGTTYNALAFCSF